MIEEGEALASLLHILAAGQAVIVTRAGSMAELPADARAAIAPDAVEEDLLAGISLRLLADSSLRRRVNPGCARGTLGRCYRNCNSPSTRLYSPSCRVVENVRDRIWQHG